MLVFFFSPLMYRFEVCLVSLYMLRLCVSVRMKTERLGPLAGAATGEQANECVKQKQREEGRRVGLGEVWRGENESMHCGGWTGLEANALVHLL